MALLTIGLILTAVAGAASAKMQHTAGKEQAKAYERQAMNEETQARDRELARKQKINRVMAAQIAGLGASGITGEGTPQFIAKENIRQESLDGLADIATRAGRERELSNMASASRKLGGLQAATTLLSTAGNMYLAKSGIE